jgi:N6-adenosine-specific RNA methylase IME4
MNYDLPKTGAYGVIYSDPPWTFQTWSQKGKGKSAEQHYHCMTLDDIKALPVCDLAAKDSVLFLWATTPMLPQAIDTMLAWGFTYKSCLAWVKLTKAGKPHFGTGHIFRNCVEMCLLGTRGHPKVLNHRTRNVLLSPRREHSRKPDEMYPLIEEMYAGPYLEMFARSLRPGWTAFGDEAEKFGEVAA